MTESQLIQLLDVFIIASNVLTAPFTWRMGRRWTAASQIVLAIVFTLVVWGRSGEHGSTFVLGVGCLLIIALIALTVMSLREMRRELAKPR